MKFEGEGVGGGTWGLSFVEYINKNALWWKCLALLVLNKSWDILSRSDSVKQVKQVIENNSVVWVASQLTLNLMN